MMLTLPIQSVTDDLLVEILKQLPDSLPQYEIRITDIS